MKKCTVCKIEKSLDSFHKRAAKRDGLRSECKECGKKNTLEYRTDNKDKVNELNRIAYYNNHEERLEYATKHRSSEYQNEYTKKRLKRDPVFRAIFNARNRTRHFAKNGKGYSKSLGCSVDQFKAHIESLFQSDMSWENYGEWELDHKFPLSIAYKNGSVAFSKACHYTNLQPLWAEDNLKKSNKVA